MNLSMMTNHMRFCDKFCAYWTFYSLFFTVFRHHNFIIINIASFFQPLFMNHEMVLLNVFFEFKSIKLFVTMRTPEKRTNHFLLYPHTEKLIKFKFNFTPFYNNTKKMPRTTIVCPHCDKSFYTFKIDRHLEVKHLNIHELWL
jgi:hypothetical protein